MRFLIVLLFLALCSPAWADYAWPDQVVKIEDMKVLTPLRISVPRVRSAGEVRGPAVLRVHVDQGGLVRRVALLESCGSPTHDEAAMHAMRGVTFSPRQIDGMPVDVSLVVPLHLPLPKYPSRP